MVDIFNETETEFQILSRNPISFIVVGKPGSGKTTLARRLASVWKCQLVNGTTALEELLGENTPLAKEASKRLLSGEELDESYVGEIIRRKLESKEIQHYGYVLDCFPSYDESWKTVNEQLEFIKNLKQPPDVIINLKIPDSDLLKRRVGQKVDPLTNEVFIKSSYDPEPSTRQEQDKEETNEEEDDDQEEDKDDEEAMDTPDDEFSEDLGEVDELQQLAPDIATRLIVRRNDSPAVVEEEIVYYKQSLLRNIEDYIIQHNQQYVVELDGNLSPKQVFRSLLVHLTSLSLPRATAPKRLITPEDGEEEDEPVGMETEQFLAQLSGTGVIDPNFHWRRSRWGKYCPVELAKGNMVQGRMEFAVGLLDKMYCLSSAEALTLFYKNPRDYILPPNPRVPCKLCVLGPPLSGKSTLATKLAEHYKATVVNVESLLSPVLERAREKSIQSAKEKAKEEALSRLSVEKEALHSQKEAKDSDADMPPITEEHPEVQEAMKKAEEQAKVIEPTADMFVEALREGIKIAEEQRQKDSEDGRRYGGWIVDGFPTTREHWSSMIDSHLLPDAVLSLENSDNKDLLLQRFCISKGLPDPTSMKKESTEKEKDGEESTSSKAAVHPEVEKWQKGCSEFVRSWGMLSEAIKGSAIDPISIGCSLPVDDILQRAVQCIESVFELLAVEPDEDADVDDDPVLEEVDGDEDEGDELSSKRRKPWGDTSYYCPVSLKDQGVLWPGNLDICSRYKERLYSFSTDEAKEKFTDSPENYIAQDKPLLPPAPRILLLGPRGSGKTAVGRKLATRMGIFHICFREFLQSIILPKMKKPPLVDPDDFEGDEELDAEEQSEDAAAGNDDLDEDVAEALTEKESEIRSYLLHGEQLSEELLEELIEPFWKNEPYRSTGFIMESFPQQGEELRFVCSKALFPDSAVVLEVEEEHVIKRLMPGKMEIWRRKWAKKVEKRTLARQKILHEWEEDKAKRRNEIENEYKKNKAEREAEKTGEEGSDLEEEDDDDPFLDDYQEQMAELDAEEPPEEEEMEDEGEEEFEERTMTALREKYEEQTDTISSVQDVLSELQIPCHAIQAGRKIDVVLYSLQKSLSRYFADRDGLLTKCTAVKMATAKLLVDHGYKQLSRFGYWCPVELSDNPRSALPPLSTSLVVPVIYRQRIYFLSSVEARNKFILNPEKYLRQQVPQLPVPVRIALVGPPKSGKTTVAKRFSSEYGCLRLSIGEAMRRVISTFPTSDLASQMQSYLKSGQTVPDELCVMALERALLDVQCNTRGYVLDGWPITMAQVDLLNKYRIIPVTIVELNISDEELLSRADVDRTSTDRPPYPVHDSPSVLMVKSQTYCKHLQPIKKWYSSEHKNWYTLDGQMNQWHVWKECQNIALKSALQIQQYLIRITKGQAASISCLCITPAEFKNRLGEYSNYCPVRLRDHGELLDCSNQKDLTFAVEYRGFYYRTSGEEELQSLLDCPEVYVGDQSSTRLPPPDMLPQRRTEVEVKDLFPRQYELQGFCPVTYINGKRRYEYLVPGLPLYSLEYKSKLYCCESEEKLHIFMRSPHKYEVSDLPVKLPPVRQPINISSLPMLGYMEQTVASSIINSLTAVGCFKPKFPFITATQSALLYVALHLKAFNPKSSTYIREKYRQKLQNFEKQCHLISYLMKSMEFGYKEPQQRPLEFDSRMSSFLALSS